jgi:hypothetical protein
VTALSVPSTSTQSAVVATPPWVADCAATVPRTQAEQFALPRASGDLLTLIATCNRTVQRMITDGQFASIFLPAMMGKDVALALEGHLNELPLERRADAARAIRSLVIAAWELDKYGDFGNRDKVSEAYTHFSSAVAEIAAAYGTQRPNR